MQRSVYSTIAQRADGRAGDERSRGRTRRVLVMTHRNAPRMKPAPVFMTAPKAAAGDDLPIMQDDRSTGTASRSHSCSPGRRNRRITPAR